MIGDAISYLFADLFRSFDEISVTTKAAACLLMGLVLIWKATSGDGDRGLKFFLSGFLGLILVAQAAMLFANTTEARRTSSESQAFVGQLMQR
jgi:hypothetical protein